MRKAFFAILATIWAMTATAQPRPFEIDNTFQPTLQYMQKHWTGEYDGMENNSKMIVTINRSLTLNNDMTYINEVWGQVKNETGTVLLRHETGTYQYDTETRLLSYSVGCDSTIDINDYLQDEATEYTVNHYKEEGLEKVNTEMAQFTAAATDDQRQWVLFDPQLMSPVDPRQRAVYVMNGEPIETTIVPLARLHKDDLHATYQLNGMKTGSRRNGLHIVNGRMTIVRE